MHEVARLQLPAHGASVRYIRLLAGALADDLGFDYEEVEDVRIAVNELTFVLLEAGEPSGALEIVLRQDGRQLEVAASVAMAVLHPATEPSDLMTKIISAVVDSFEIDVSHEVACYKLRKNRR